MTDTNKEREIERLTETMINYVPHLSDTPAKARKVAEILVDQGVGYPGDRVGQTFTEEGFRKYWMKKTGGQVAFDLFALAAEYAATLQPQQTMGREVVTLLEELSSQGPHEGTQTQWIEKLKDKAHALLGKIPAPSSAVPLESVPSEQHPVEGELTLDEVSKLCGDHTLNLAQTVDAIFARHQSTVAATEARVREEYGATLSAAEQVIRDNEANHARLCATIADLNAKLETAVQIPPVEEWPENASCICTGFVAGNPDHWVNRDKADWSMVSVILRPAPKTLTNEEKLEKVISWKAGSEPVDREWSMRQVLSAWANGKSIDELYAEVVKGGEK